MNHSGTVELETERLRLRRFRREDAENCLRNWAADEAVFRFISQTPMSGADVKSFLAGAEEAYADPETYYWAIEKKDTGDVMGEIFVDDFSRRNRWCEVDYKLGPAFWGQGYAVEALRAVTAFLFRQAGFHRVQAKCSVQNEASERVMQKAGMHREGVMREFFRRKDASGYDDVVMYAVLNEKEGPEGRETITNW